MKIDIKKILNNDPLQDKNWIQSTLEGARAETKPASEPAVEQHSKAQPDNKPAAEQPSKSQPETKPAIETAAEQPGKSQPETKPASEPAVEQHSKAQPDNKPATEPAAEQLGKTQPDTKLAAAPAAEQPGKTQPDTKPAAAPAPEAEGAESEPAPARVPLHKKYGWLAAIAASFIVLLAVTFVYTTMIPRDVQATINGETKLYSSTKHTVEGFLGERGISYCDEDYISTPLTTFIYDGIKFNLEHAADFKVTADGKTAKYKTLNDTVGEALKEEKIKVGKLDIVTPDIESPVEDGMQIVVQRVVIKEETVEEAVHFKTVKKSDSSMNEGSSKVITKGKNGKAKVTYSVKYIDGVESSKKEISRKTIKPAVNKVVAKGTRISVNGMSYSRKLVVRAYAYTGGGRTAMGTQARVGEIAVDPSVIPLGSTVYIEGVGVRRAEDTGGNIQGNTIDIYMSSNSECLRWGVRYVTIYIQ